ncbi:acyltransferase family protein [Devosia sp. XGJD_8]|uniref:acyltransferase family protein n=1 Tax=Devosia sp. XGJD_8 TaxID=3391187 RepID=UPI00398508C1
MTIEGSTPREAGIDLLRSLSVVLVVMSHYGLLPEWFPLGGYHGVIVFFAVSGYCMAMTAPKKEFWSFWVARCTRLLPALVVCALITFAVEAALSAERGQTGRDLMLTLFCIPTLDVPCEVVNAWAKSRDSGLQYLFVDGAYWSLLVEFRFYFVFSIFYFGVSRIWHQGKRFTWVAVLAASLLAFSQPEFGQGRARDFFQYLPFFAFGLAAFQVQTGDRIAGYAGLIASMLVLCSYSMVGISSVSAPFGLESTIKYLALLSFSFWAMLWKARHSRSTVPIKFVATISYPLYLIHQDVGLALIDFAATFGLDPLATKLGVGLIVILIATIIHRTVEINALRIAYSFPSKASARHA